MKLLFSRPKWVVVAWLLSAALLGSTAPARAAPPALPALPADTIRPQPPTRADTAAALRRLFAQQRRAGRGRLVAAGLSALTSNFLVASSRQETVAQRVGTGLLVGVLGLNAYTLGKELVRRRRYRPAREQRLLAGLAQQQPLPRWLRRKLVTEFFSASAVPSASPN